MSETMRASALPLIALALFVLPLVGGPFWVVLATTILIYAISASSLNLIFGYAGRLDSGHALYFGVGGYTVVLFAMHLPKLPTILGVAVAVALAAIMAGSVAIVLVRLAGLFFAIATLAVAFGVQAIVEGFSYTGSFTGLGASTRGLLADGSNVTARELYVVVLVIGVGVYLAISSFARSRVGRIAQASKDIPEAVEAVGVELVVFRSKLFLIAGALAGLAGALYALSFQFMAPSDLGITASVSLIVMTVFGGLGVPIGPLLGALLVVGLPQAVQGVQNWETVIAGAGLLLVVVAGRGGAATILSRVAGAVRWRRRVEGYKRMATSSATGGSGSEGALTTGKSAKGEGSSLTPPGTIHVQEGSPRREGTERATGAQGSEVLLALHGVSRHFSGIRAVFDLSLRVRSNEIHALIGPNGAGKSTILGLLSGSIPVSSGRVEWRDTDVTKWSSSRRAELGIARTFQVARLSQGLSIRQNITIGCWKWAPASITRSFLGGGARFDRKHNELTEEVDRILEKLGLEGFAEENSRVVPVGVQRLAEVGRCLAGRPSVVLLDEPGVGLAAEEKNELCRLLADVRDSGVGVLLVEHDMDLVRAVADTVSVVSDGILLAEGPVGSTMASDLVTEAYLGVPRLATDGAAVPDS